MAQIEGKPALGFTVEGLLGAPYQRNSEGQFTGVHMHRDDERTPCLDEIAKMAAWVPQRRIASKLSLGPRESVSPTENGKKIRKFIRKYGQDMADAVGMPFEAYIESLPPFDADPIETISLLDGRVLSIEKILPFLVDPRITGWDMKKIFLIEFHNGFLEEQKNTKSVFQEPYIAWGTTSLSGRVQELIETADAKLRVGNMQELLFCALQKQLHTIGDICASGSTTEFGVPVLNNNWSSIGKWDVMSKDAIPPYTFVVKC